MKRFIKNIINFILFVVITNLLLVGITLVLEWTIVDFSIAKNKDIFIVGDSHTECAINDSIVDNVYNFSYSGAGYFYSYLKTRKMVEDNPQIKKVVLGYSYGDIAVSRDSWYYGSEKVKFFMPQHLFLFEAIDFWELLTTNPVDVIQFLHRTTHTGLFHIYRYLKNNGSLHSWGRYRHLKRDKLEQAKQREENQNSNIAGFSRYQELYLKRMYNYLNSKGIEFVLLNAPIHPILEKREEGYKERYYNLVKDELPGATLINHSDFELHDSCFADLGHLNYKGAKIYSEFLRDNDILNR